MADLSASESSESSAHSISKAASGLNANQVAAIVSRLAYLDKLFAHLDELARGAVSPFSVERPDFTPDEAALLQAFVTRARTALVTALDTLGIERPVATGSARWSATTTLTFADITAGEMTGSFLRGYGPVHPDAVRAVEGIARRLRAIIQDGKALLHEQDPGGLADRLARLNGPVGEVLRLVDTVSTMHRLASIRPLAAAAADRAEDTLFAVGVFGRVSAGKSSLIDALLGSDILPVGATPVTAVPVSIEQGAESVVVDFVAGNRTSVALAALPDFVTEQGNPDNRRGVRSVQVQVPVAPAGIRLLDTPGVGSLAGGGPARTFAWLPRCDLGLVLIAAGTPVGRDELALVSGLVNAGIECRVLLSKADLLGEGDRRAAVQYVHDTLTLALGAAAVPPILAVSVRAEGRTLLDELRHDVLEPLAAEHVMRAHAALVRRLRSLVTEARRAVALSGSNSGGASSVNTASDIVAHDGEHALVTDAPAMDAALRSIHATTDALARSATSILEAATGAVTAAWEEGVDGRDAARASIVNAVGSALARVRDAVPDNSIASDDAANAGDERIPPLFDAEFLDTLPPLDPPSLLPGALRHRTAARRLAEIKPALDSALDRYAIRLAAWGDARVHRRAEHAVISGAAAQPPDDVPQADLPDLAEAARIVESMESTASPSSY